MRSRPHRNHPLVAISTLVAAALGSAACGALFGLQEREYSDPDGSDAGTSEGSTSGDRSDAPSSDDATTDATADGGIDASRTRSDAAGDDSGEAGRDSGTGGAACVIDAGGIPGRLDPAFASGFKPTRQFLRGGALDAHGRVYVIGSAFCSDSGTDRDFLVTRLTENGALDTSFGASGAVCIDFDGRTDSPYTITFDDRERAVIVGEARSDSDTSAAIAIARLDTNGVLDATFNAGGATPGKMRLDPPARPTALDGHAFSAFTALASQDGIVIAGGDGTIFDQRTSGFLFRLTPAGAVDPAFAPAYDDRVAGFLAMARVSDGFVAAGEHRVDKWYGVAKLTATGAPVAAFGGSDAGLSTVPAGLPRQILVDPDGVLFVGGPRLQDSAARVIRLDAQGNALTTSTWDGTFTGAGPWEEAYDFTAIALQCDGKLVVGSDLGVPGKGWGFQLQRFDADGRIDSAYGGADAGIVTVGTPDRPSRQWGIQGLFFDSRTNATVVLVGRSENDGFEVYRFLP